jgi:hypothetical protein
MWGSLKPVFCKVVPAKTGLALPKIADNFWKKFFRIWKFEFTGTSLMAPVYWHQFIGTSLLAPV